MLASAFLHAALAWTIGGRFHPGMEAVRAAPPPIRAEGGALVRVRLLALEAAASGTEPSLRVDDQRPPEKKGARVRGPPRLGSLRAAVDERQAAISPQAPEASEAPPSADELKDWTPQPSQGGPESATETSSPPSGRGGSVPAVSGLDDAGWLAELHRRLNAAAQKCYPPRARRLRLRGEVSLLFALNAQGEASRVELARSSGSPILDEAATECVLRGALPAPGRPGDYGPVTIKFSEQP